MPNTDEKLESLTDSDINHLIDEAKLGNQIAMKTLLFERGVFSSAYSLDEYFRKTAQWKLRNDDYAEDVVADVLLGICKGIRSFKHEAKFSTWCFRILKNNIGKKLTDLSKTISYEKFKKFLIEEQDALKDGSDKDLYAELVERLPIVNY